jgi:hypothetical protein
MEAMAADAREQAAALQLQSGLQSVALLLVLHCCSLPCGFTQRVGGPLLVSLNQVLPGSRCSFAGS